MKKSSSVFIGNIDFDVPENQIITALSTVGKVKSFKLIYDKTTGKSKGYGFAEYESPLIAQTALNTLNLTFNGRKAKVNPTTIESQSVDSQKAEIIKPENLKLETNKIFKVIKNFDRKNLLKVLLYLKKMALNSSKKFREVMDEENSKDLLFCLVNLELLGVEELKVYLNENKVGENRIEEICEIVRENKINF